MPRDETYLIYMLTAAKRVTTYIHGMSRVQFDLDPKTMDSVVLQLGNIGEAANQVSIDYQKLHREVPWSKIIGMRHRIFHKYVEIDWDIVWFAATEEVPALIRYLEPLVPPENP
jgi:uncharacterized protein with HEPN domain